MLVGWEGNRKPGGKQWQPTARFYGFGHLRADSRGPGSAPEPYIRFKYGIFLPFCSQDYILFVRSPDSLQQSLLEASPIAQLSPSDLPPFWRGSICAQEIAKVLVSAYLVSGSFNVPREVCLLCRCSCISNHWQRGYSTLSVWLFVCLRVSWITRSLNFSVDNA